MSRRAKAGIVFLAVGILLLSAALGLFQYNREEAAEAEESARAVLERLAPAIEERMLAAAEAEPEAGPDAEPDALPPAEPVELDPTMPTVEIDGLLYIGFLTIPDLDLELPVMDDWDYEKLKIAPCRYSGTILENDLTIAAHNYVQHFGRLMDLTVGADLLFTDALGRTTAYKVAELEILQPTDVEYLTAGEYDLTLFTCTYGGATRFTVRCLRA